MRKMGAPQWFIDKQTEKDKPAEEDDFLDVLAPNWTTVLVYMACQWTIETGGTKPVFRGISAQELRAAVDLVGAPSDEWPRVHRGVQVMVDEARQEFDEAVARASASRGGATKKARAAARR